MSLNYLNIMVSCSKLDCALTEMFFDRNGNVPVNYPKWLDERFLINGMENQSVTILNGIL